MQGLMQNVPLLISSLIQHADRHHGTVEIVSRRVEGDIHRTTYRQMHARAKQLANLLDAWGVGEGRRVATLAWNGYRHMELYYAVAGKGAIVHTINPRLVPDQIAWIVNHAEDTCLFFDLTFLPIVEKVAAQFRTVKYLVAMTDRAHMPAGTSQRCHGTVPAGLRSYNCRIASGSCGASRPRSWNTRFMPGIWLAAGRFGVALVRLLPVLPERYELRMNAMSPYAM